MFTNTPLGQLGVPTSFGLGRYDFTPQQGANTAGLVSNAADVPVQGEDPYNLANGRFEAGLRRPVLLAPVINGVRRHPQIYFKMQHPTDYTNDRGEKKRYSRYYRGIDLVMNGWASPMILNATGLRKEEWIQLDAVIRRAARYPMRVAADLEAASSFGGFNGMGKTSLEYEAMSDPGEAIVDMDALTPGRTDAPLFQLRGLPLPITHCDFHFSARKLQISQNSGTPLDATMGEAAGRRVGESIERTTLGNQVGILFGGNSTYVGGYDMASQVFGYTTHPHRLTVTNMTDPTTGSWTPLTTVNEVIRVIRKLKNNKYTGPFMMYASTDWDPYLDQDYTLSASPGVTTKTLRNRIREITGIIDCVTSEFLRGSNDLDRTQPGSPNRANDFNFIFVQFTPDVAQMVNGMDITTLQWPTHGGMRNNFKVMCIKVPRIMSDFYSKMGLAQAITGTTAADYDSNYPGVTTTI